MTHELENPFPSDDEVRFMADLSHKLLSSEFGAVLGDIGIDAETSYRCTILSKLLQDARANNQWTLKQCSQILGVKSRQLSALESGDFEKSEPERVVRYVQLLGVENLFRQWLAANAAFAAQLGLSAAELDHPRPADWPKPKPFVLPPDAYRVSPEKRTAMQARMDALQNLVGTFGGFGGDSFEDSPAEDPRQEAAPPAVYQFKITLRHVTPPVWRRVQVPNDVTFGQLHRVIQMVMGWHNCHLHEFRVHETRFGMARDPLGGPLELDEAWDEDDYRLCEVGLRAKSKFKYEYDFGDGWEHQIALEKVLPLQSGFVPVCLKGARACPPEDCGGPWGYAENLAILADTKHPEHKEIADWMGKHFDPEAFDLQAVNRRLNSLGRSWKKTRSRGE